MFLKNIITFVFGLVVISESAFVDSLQKCSKDDHECLKQSLQRALITLSENGIPEHDIPALDPAVVKNTTISVLDILNLSFDGVIKGLKKAIINKFTLNVNDGVILMDITCDVVVKGKYNAFSSSPVLKNLLGKDSVHGNGDGSVKIEQLNIGVEVLFDFVKQGDDIFLDIKKDKLKYTYNIGKMVFKANNLYVGDQESSASIVNLLNQNWKSLANSFGKNFIDVAVDFIYDVTKKILSNVSAKYFIVDDLSEYVKN